LNVAPVKRIKADNKDVLLIERFDRTKKDQGWSRKAMVSALTLLGLDDMMARYASYETFAEIIRHRFTDPKATLKEVFSRLVFNLETSVEWDLECVDFDFRQGAMRRNNALLQRIAT
jgi:serine/threonine-protein kinase HipA